MECKFTNKLFIITKKCTSDFNEQYKVEMKKVNNIKLKYHLVILLKKHPQIKL